MPVPGAILKANLTVHLVFCLTVCPGLSNGSPCVLHSDSLRFELIFINCADSCKSNSIKREPIKLKRKMCQFRSKKQSQAPKCHFIAQISRKLVETAFQMGEFQLNSAVFRLEKRLITFCKTKRFFSHVNEGNLIYIRSFDSC